MIKVSKDKNVIDRVDEYFNSIEKRVEKRHGEKIATDMLYTGLIVGAAIGAALMMFVNSF